MEMIEISDEIGARGLDIRVPRSAHTGTASRTCETQRSEQGGHTPPGFTPPAGGPHPAAEDRGGPMSTSGLNG